MRHTHSLEKRSALMTSLIVRAFDRHPSLRMSACVAMMALACLGASADPLSTTKATALLLSSGGLDGSIYRAGMDVRLLPGVMTYWSFPGDAGVPPVFDFAGSDNVAQASVLYPAPQRIVEEGATVFGWRQEVVFPIDVKPGDPSRPSSLRVVMHYATCDVICVPAEADETLLLSPKAPQSDAAAKLAVWRDRAPVPLPAALTPRVERLPGAGDPHWRISFPSSAPSDDLIAVGADGWFFFSKGDGSGSFDVTLQQKPSDAPKSGAPARLTYVAKDRAYQTDLDLDAAAALR